MTEPREQWVPIVSGDCICYVLFTDNVGKLLLSGTELALQDGKVVVHENGKDGND